MVAPLGEKPNIWVECIFVNPIADIAVLCEPDNQVLGEESEAYYALVEEITPLNVSQSPENTPAWLLSKDGRWFQCKMRRKWVYDAKMDIVGGMSGSPVINAAGKAIGVVCTSNSNEEDATSRKGGPNPRLNDDLPGWLLRELEVS